MFVGLRGPVTACAATKYRVGDAALRCCAPAVFTAVAAMPGVDPNPDTTSLFRFGAQYRVEPAPASVGELPYARPPRRAAARSGSSGKRGHVSRCHRVPLMLDGAAHRRLPNVAGRSGEVRRRSQHLGEPPHLGKLAQHACGAAPQRPHHRRARIRRPDPHRAVHLIGPDFVGDDLPTVPVGDLLEHLATAGR